MYERNSDADKGMLFPRMSFSSTGWLNVIRASVSTTNLATNLTRFWSRWRRISTVKQEWDLWTVMITEKLQCGVPFHPRNVSLVGTVYFEPGENHFVSNIVMEDNQVWYYDPLINGDMQDHLDRPVTIPFKR